MSSACVKYKQNTQRIVKYWVCVCIEYIIDKMAYDHANVFIQAYTCRLQINKH